MSAYIAGLKMLGRRELSEKQIRQRLARKEFSQEDIDDAVARLREERAIDDQRVAEAIARSEISLRQRGKIRVPMQSSAAGIAKDAAEAAIDDVFGDVDERGAARIVAAEAAARPRHDRRRSRSCSVSSAI